MSGRRRGVVASTIRATLRMASLPYGLAVAFRNRQFSRGSREIHRAEVPVVSVGNLTTGGTGKTPVVAYLAETYRSMGLRVSIVSRGYGRGDADENDEAAELHQRLPDVPHVQNPDRVEAARIAVEELETQLILMDDGFQHRRLGRDLDLVLVDATCPFGYEALLPRGLLREPIKNVARADGVILTRCDQVSQADVKSIVQRIRVCHPRVPIVHSTHRPSGLLQFPNSVGNEKELNGQKVGLVCGIGNPDAFRRTIEDLGAEVIAEYRLPDHAAYDRETVGAIKNWVQAHEEIDRLVCTQKDLVKIQTDRLAGKPLAALLIEADIEASDEFDQLLRNVVPRAT